MAKLTAAQRKKLPKSDFGLPGKKGKNGKNKAGKGGYPMPDKKHAAVAKDYAKQEEEKGKLSKAEENKIDAKANRVIKANGGTPGKPKNVAAKVSNVRAAASGLRGRVHQAVTQRTKR